MEKIYFLLIKNNNSTFPSSLHFLKNGTVRRLHLHRKVCGDYIQSYLEVSNSIEFEFPTGENMLNAYFTIGPFANRQDLKGEISFIEATNKKGEFFPRVYRPLIQIFGGVHWNPKKKFEELENEIRDYREFPFSNKKDLILSVNQLAVLVQSLNSLFQAEQPDSCNLDVYGHNIRNLLILACTEVEAQLKGVLVAASTSSRSRYTTKDYVKLCKLLKLKEYSIKLGHYPGMSEIRPFINWDELNPTQSLFWYDNYNAVKHDRENEFSKATLKSVIEAVAALAILLIAQYGEKIPFWKDLVGGFFILKDTPQWDLLDYYIPPLEGEAWRQKKVML